MLIIKSLIKGILKRIHSAIGYVTPAQKMAELEKVA